MSRFSGKADVYDWFFLGRDCDLDYIKRSRIYIKYPSDIELKIPPCQIHIETMKDLVPYYPYLIYSGARGEDNCTIYISSEPYPDTLWRELGHKPLMYDTYKEELRKEMDRLENMDFKETMNREEIKFSQNLFSHHNHLQQFLEWWQENTQNLFRYWIYKKGFTPYEEEEKFTDESIFEDDYASLGYIKDVAVLPDNDLLLGFLQEDCGTIEYVKLSEIRMNLYKCDQKNE